MKTAMRRIISAVISGAVVTAVALISVIGAGTTQSGAGIDRVVVDCSSKAAFKKTSFVRVHKPTEAEPDPYTGGKYSFSDELKAMEVEYNQNAPAGREYRILTQFNTPGIVTTEYKYFVIVYSAKTTEAFKLSVWNGGGQGKEVFAVADGKDTNNEFLISDPVDISDADSQGRSTISRWANGAHSTISFITTDKNAKFFIKEYAFFKTAEDAKAYYSAENREELPGGSGGTASDPDNNVFVSYTTPVEEPQPEENISTEPPVIMNFESLQSFRKNSWFKVSDDGLNGLYEFVTLADGTGCLKLNYSEYSSSYANYRVMPSFSGAGKITADHKYARITYMTTDAMPNIISIRNNASGKTAVLVHDTSMSGGEFIVSGPVNIAGAGLAQRFSEGKHSLIEFSGSLTDSEIYIKELAFFTSREQAYEYYGDSASASTVDYTELTFGTIGNAVALRTDPLWGNSSDSADTLDITYCAETGLSNQFKYMAKIRLKTKETLDNTLRYIRILYSADNPDDVTRASIYLHDDAKGTRVLASDNVVDTNGEFVLTPVTCISENMTDRIGNIHLSVLVNSLSEGGKYSIKAVYLFHSREEAENFANVDAAHTLMINGNDISQYQIVVDEDAPANIKGAAEAIAAAIDRITGVDVPIVTDSTPASGYEIILGKSNRLASYTYPDDLQQDGASYHIFVNGNNLVIESELDLSVAKAAEIANKALFYSGKFNVPGEINIGADTHISYIDDTYTRIDYWNEGAPVSNPDVFCEDFDVDDGYFNEDNGEDNWRYEGGAYKTDAKDLASSYIHVYEKNVNYKAKLSYTSENGGSMGIMARVNSKKAYVKAGYDFDANEWYIESRDGGDFYLERVASAKAEISPNTVYELTLNVLGETASLAVNGTEVITDAKLTHFSPGRLGVYAENASVSVDDIELVLVSGQGTILKNVAHTKLPGESYLEGGTVIERNDGSLSYVSTYNVAYKSIDNGITWESCDMWADNHKHSYPNIIRLNNGDLLRIVTDTANAHKISQTSSDDGMTWSTGGIICDSKYNGTHAGAGNMNDKLFQSGTTDRIFYCQTYETSSESDAVDGRRVFCCFYYSDDNGAAWTKSDTDSWEIAGNEAQAYFSECKILECADGTIRIYCSWNQYGYIAYSDSIDGGKTFGPIQMMPTMYTPAASMQFVRDPYAENDTTYYMVWVNADDDMDSEWHHPRYRLSLAKSTDGKEWAYLGDIWRWESTYMEGEIPINHIVNPFICVTEDYVICGSGFSDSLKVPGETGPEGHKGQRQHIYSIKKDTLPEGNATGVFTDVEYGAPYYEAVSFVYNEKLFQGTSSDTFSPDAAMTRAMFVTVLGRLSGAEMSSYTTPTFNDVLAGAWYTPYVEWAAANGIVNGYGTGLFGVDDMVTVQQACIILAKYAGYKNVEVGTGKTSADYPDNASIADWAKKEVEWAIANGIYTGTAGNIAPTAPASRALVAEMFNNYVKAFGR